MDQLFMLSIIITIIFTTISLLFINKSKYKNLPPSPQSLPIIGHLHIIKKPLQQTLAGLAKRFGPVILLRFGSRRVLVISSPSAAIECFTTNDIVFANRPQVPSFRDFSYDYTTMGQLHYGPRWRNFRRIATVDVLSNHRLLSFYDVRKDEVHALARLLLQQHSVSDKDKQGFARVEIKSRLFQLGMNIMTRMIAGKRYYGESNAISEQALRFRRIMKESAELLVFFSNPVDVFPVLRWFGFRGVEKKLKILHDMRDEMLQELIDEHRRDESTHDGKKCMIGNLLELQKVDPENNTDLIIKALTISLLQAGTSTTSDTIEWALSLLLNHPHILKKLQAEIDEHVGNERLFNETDLANLPYLQCVINETLRVKPITPFLVPHESSQDCIVHNYNIPGKTMLLVNIYAIQRDPKVWNEPLKFKPERFLDENKSADENSITRWMIPFGMGRRKCVGEVLALKVVGLTLGTLIQCFDWDRVDGREIDMSEATGFATSKVVPLEAMYCPRSSMSGVFAKLLEGK